MLEEIKYYQDDNLRQSNELIKLSGKSEYTKNQLKYLENNKHKFMSQLENLNNIISEGNIKGSPFNITISKIDDKSSVEQKISDEKQITENKFQKIIIPKRINDPEKIDHLTRKIFKK